jgi:uncharacterized protein YciI
MAWALTKKKKEKKKKKKTPLHYDYINRLD